MILLMFCLIHSLRSKALDEQQTFMHRTVGIEYQRKYGSRLQTDRCNYQYLEHRSSLDYTHLRRSASAAPPRCRRRCSP